MAAVSDRNWNQGRSPRPKGDHIHSVSSRSEQIFEGDRAANIIRVIPEPNKTLAIVRECDVVVVGGCNIPECIVFGHVAGEPVAAEKPWS
jgi:hypothetical protein